MRALALCFIAVILVGCGSTSYADKVAATVSTMNAAISSYNQTRSADLQGAGTACGRASASLVKAPPLDAGSAPQTYRSQVLALDRAIRLASIGFSACSEAAKSLNYSLMIQAMSRLTEADNWMRKASNSRS